MSRLEELLQEAHALVRDPYGALGASEAARDGRCWGYTCLFAPDELLEAAGLLPVRLFGAAASLHRAERCITSNCCEFARSLLESFLDGRFAFLEGVLIPHSCDPLQVAMDIARSEGGLPFHFFNMPTCVDPVRAKPILLSELERLRSALEQRLGRSIDSARLEAACEAAERQERLLSDLYALRRSRPGLISGTDASALTLAGLFLSRETHARWLEVALQELTHRSYQPPRRFVRRLLVSGFLNGSVRLIEMIERSGAIVVDDDLCEGSRRLTRTTSRADDPLERIATRMLGRTCPVKIGGDRTPNEILRERYLAADADGAILAHFPFCDPQLLETADLRHRNADREMDVLPLEVTIGDRNYGQLQTRVEAFLERLRPRRRA